jgi:SAM-dependent methyltransferase
MDRIPEPEVMNGEEQARAYASADYSDPHNTFVALFRERFGEVAGAAVDLGCGPADVTLRFARSYPECTVDGLDASPAMLRLGLAAVKRAGLIGRVNLYRLYLPLERAPLIKYPVVISNSLLHHLPDADATWKTVRQVAAPGAAVFVRDLRRPRDEHEWEHLVSTYGFDCPTVLQHDFRASLRAAYTPKEIRKQLEESASTNTSTGQASPTVAKRSYPPTWLFLGKPDPPSCLR